MLGALFPASAARWGGARAVSPVTSPVAMVTALWDGGGRVGGRQNGWKMAGKRSRIFI